MPPILINPLMTSSPAYDVISGPSPMTTTTAMMMTMMMMWRCAAASAGRYAIPTAAVDWTQLLSGGGSRSTDFVVAGGSVLRRADTSLTTQDASP